FGFGATVLVTGAALALVFVAAGIDELLSMKRCRIINGLNSDAPHPGPPAVAGDLGTDRGPARSDRGSRPGGRLVVAEHSDRSPGPRLRGTRSHGSITILRERITKWVLIEILDFFHALSTVICKIHLALIRHICSIKSDRSAWRRRGGYRSGP